jgi:hypothetical protein
VSGLGVWVAGFAERLRGLGWIEKRTIAIKYRWSEGRSEHVAEAAADFVRQKPDAIVTYRGAVPAFKQATTSIPIVLSLRSIPSASAWSTTSRIRAVTSPGCRFISYKGHVLARSLVCPAVSFRTISRARQRIRRGGQAQCLSP